MQAAFLNSIRFQAGADLRMASTVPCRILCSDRSIFVASLSCRDKSFRCSLFTLSSIEPTQIITFALNSALLRMNNKDIHLENSKHEALYGA